MKRKSTYQIWTNEREAPAARLVAFETWLFSYLGEKLEWPANPAARKKQIGQCRALVMQAVADMGRHGYLFQPRPLYEILTAKIDEIAELQRMGKVTNLYPYFRAVWRGYVGEKSEELRDLSMQLGTHIGQLAAASFERTGKPLMNHPSIPGIVNSARRESLREAAAKERRRARAAAAEERQGKLL